MARICSICDKRPRVGNMVSNANNRVKQWLYPNVHKLRFTKVGDPSGKVYNTKVCTRCVKANKVKKVI